MFELFFFLIDLQLGNFLILGFGNGGRRWKFRTGCISRQYGGRFQQVAIYPEEERANRTIGKESEVNINSFGKILFFLEKINHIFF